MRFPPFIHLFLALLLAPLLLGVINRTKALFAGRRGQPLLQSYYDIWKLLKKGAVYSQTTTWVFRAGPIVGLATIVLAITLMPLGKIPALVVFQGDFILFAYLLGLIRFFIVISALDTGSSFEGMGASREMQFSTLAEPALFLGLATIARRTGTLSLTEMIAKISLNTWQMSGLAFALVVVALLVVLLCENARIPVDDPNTHLELTMIHEVMVLDHSGPDLGFILYGATLKLWALGALLIGIIVPIHSGHTGLDAALSIGEMLVLAVIIGIVES